MVWYRTPIDRDAKRTGQTGRTGACAIRTEVGLTQDDICYDIAAPALRAGERNEQSQRRSSRRRKHSDRWWRLTRARDLPSPGDKDDEDGFMIVVMKSRCMHILIIALAPSPRPGSQASLIGLRCCPHDDSSNGATADAAPLAIGILRQCSMGEFWRLAASRAPPRAKGNRAIPFRYTAANGVTFA